MLNKVNGKSYHVIQVSEMEKGSFAIALDLDGTKSTSIGYINCQDKRLQEISNKYWDEDDLRNAAISFEYDRMRRVANDPYSDRIML
jgi:hypothetical protein